MAPTLRAGAGADLAFKDLGQLFRRHRGEPASLRHLPFRLTFNLPFARDPWEVE